MLLLGSVILLLLLLSKRRRRRTFGFLAEIWPSIAWASCALAGKCNSSCLAGCADVATFHSLGGRRPSRGARVLSLGGEFRFLLLSAGRRSATVFCPKDENEDQLTC